MASGRGLDDLPDDLLVRILSLVLSSRPLHCCALVSKRWRDLATRVTHFRLDPPITAAAEEGLIRWFHPDRGGDLRYLAIARSPHSRQFNHVISTRWLEQIGKSLRSLEIYGPPQQKFDRFWSRVSSCRELRCLHIHANVGSDLPALLPKLVHCTVSCLGVSGVRRLLEQCPLLVFLRVEMITARRPRATILRSESLDCLEISRCGGDCKKIFSLAIEMPRLRRLLVKGVPSVELGPSTSSVEWMLLHGDVHYRRLSYSASKLRSLTITPSFRDLEHVMQRLAPVVLSRRVGIRELTLLLQFHPPRSINLAVFLEMFKQLEVLKIARPTIKVLSLEDWSWRHSPLIVQVESAATVKNESDVVWERSDIEFLRNLMSSNGCVTMLELRGLVYRRKLNGFQSKVSAEIEELSRTFPGRVNIATLRTELFRRCGVCEIFCEKPGVLD